MREDFEVLGGGSKEAEMFDHWKVLDGLDTIMGLCVVTTPFGCVVIAASGRVVISGVALSEDEEAEMIGPEDETDGICSASLLVAITLEVSAPS